MKPLSDEELLAVLREVEVPEPSPLFWNHLSQRVHDAVAAEPARQPSWLTRLNLAWTGGLTAAVLAAVLVMAVSVHRPQPAADTAPGPAVAETALEPSLQDDAAWAVMGELASEIEIGQADAEGLTVSPGTVDEAVRQLSLDEQQRMVHLLQQEMKNTKSAL